MNTLFRTASLASSRVSRFPSRPRGMGGLRLQLKPVILACWAACSVAIAAEQPELPISVLVLNRADVSEKTLGEMKSEAGYVLGKAGIVITWIDCPSSKEPTEATSPCKAPLGDPKFLVTITGGRFAHNSSAWNSRLGYASVRSKGGSYAAVMMGAVEELARGQQLVSKGQILGHAVAHEIGHLLMGTNSHSSRGLMRGNWKVDALHEMAERQLLFSEADVERMRASAAILRDEL
jgi:hypothetical protein